MPASRIVIRSLDELLIHLGRAQQGDAGWENVTIAPKSIIVPVVTSGHGMDRRIDVRAASLIKKIQSRADELYFKYSTDGEKKSPLIKVETKDGSNWLDFDVTAVLNNLIGRIPDGDVTMVAYLLIVGAFGLGAYWLHTRHKENMANYDLVRKALESNESIAKEALGSVARFAEPARSYAGTLGEGAAVSVAGSPPLPMEEAKKILSAQRMHLSKYSVCCDGTYELLGLGLGKIPPTLRISQDNGDEVWASIRNLGQDVQDFLVDKVKNCLAAGALPQTIQLQVDVSFTEKERKNVYIVGVGEQRLGGKHYKIAEVPWLVDLSDTTPL